MSDESNPKNAGRPRVPKWDEMHDIDKLLKNIELAERNIFSGKWKQLPKGLMQMWDRHRELLMNKYPDYYKVIDSPKLGGAVAQETDDADELPPLVTPAPAEKEEIITFPGGWPGEDKEKK